MCRHKMLFFSPLDLHDITEILLKVALNSIKPLNLKSQHILTFKVIVHSILDQMFTSKLLSTCNIINKFIYFSDGSGSLLFI